MFDNVEAIGQAIEEKKLTDLAHLSSLYRKYSDLNIVRGGGSLVEPILTQYGDATYQEIEKLWQEKLNESKKFDRAKDISELKDFVHINSDFEETLLALNETTFNDFGRRASVLVGKRGAGKTFTQKYWCIKEKQQFADRKIIPIRINVHRLYELWHKVLDVDKNHKDIQSNFVSINDYISLKFIWHFFACTDNRISNKTEQGMYLHTNEVLKALNSRLLDKLVGHKYEQSFNTVVKNIKDTLIPKEQNTKSSGRKSNFIDDIIVPEIRSTRNQKQLQKSAIIKLAFFIYDWLREEGYQILFMLDGLDNIEPKNQSTASLYESYLNEIGALLSNSDGKEIENARYLLSIRPRTLKEIAIINSAELNRSTDFLNNQISIESVKFADILQTRIRYLLADVKHKEHDYAVIMQIIMNSADKWLKEPPDQLNKIYDDNVRDYLVSKRYLAKIMYFIYLTHGKRFLELNPNTDKNVYFKKMYAVWVWRAKFFVNAVHINSEILNIPTVEPGRYGCNPFYFEQRFSRAQKWNGLYMLRILQYLQINRETKEDKIVSDLVGKFGYERDILKQGILILVAFNKIEKDYLEKSVYYAISCKGQEYLNRIFSKVDLLYYFCLDTYLPKEVLSSDLIRVHSNRFRQPSRFTFSMLRTAVTFIYFLEKVSQKELEHQLDEGYQLPFEHAVILKALEELCAKQQHIPKEQMAKITADIDSLKQLWRAHEHSW